VEQCRTDGISTNDIFQQGLLKGLDKILILMQLGKCYIPDVLLSEKSFTEGLTSLKKASPDFCIPTKGAIVFISLQDSGMENQMVRLVTLYSVAFEAHGYSLEKITLDYDEAKTKLFSITRKLESSCVFLWPQPGLDKKILSSLVQELKDTGNNNIIAVIGRDDPLTLLQIAEKTGIK
jgi:hypothetical protein